MAERAKQVGLGRIDRTRVAPSSLQRRTGPVRGVGSVGDPQRLSLILVQQRLPATRRGGRKICGPPGDDWMCSVATELRQYTTPRR